jgi:protein-disulfide isomerase
MNRDMQKTGQRKSVSKYSSILSMPVSETRDHILGNPKAEITLVEYGDYQCPYCGEAYPIIKKVEQKYDDRLRMVFRNFPITELHSRAGFGAEMAESAGAQGKFWEMHDFLFERQASLNDENLFLNFAKATLGPDADRLRDEVHRQAHSSRINEDFASGVRSGVNGTPTFFMNDYRHDGGYDFDSLTDAIDVILSGPQKSFRK